MRQTWKGNSQDKQHSLLEQLQKQGVYIPADCGGIGRCGKCRVQFLSGAPEADEDDANIFSPEQIADGWRLACKAFPEGDYEIAWEQSEEEMEVASDFSHGSGDAADATEGDAAGQKAAEPVAAVDIGTTTLAVSLVDRASGKVVDTKTSVNHQRVFGADVISRIQASMDGKKEELKASIRKDLDGLITALGEKMDEIPVIISGNTTMEHLFLGLPCDTLGVAPYTPVDISLHEEDNFLILPGISTYVGADIVSGIIACGMDQGEEVCMLIDLGTNGEMAIGNKDRILSASTAAGPAFEGGNISCGVAGVPGAISSVDIAEDGSVQIGTIGGKDPIGLCGTGVLEVVYEMLKAEYMDETGLLEDDYVDDGFPLSDDVVFTDQDVREVQLAKSAIRAGAETLMEEYGVGYDDISALYLAGGFGQKINLQKAAGIGLLPEELLDRTKAVGNSSLAGAVMIAKDETLKERFAHVADYSEEVSLTGNPTFNDLYMEYMMFEA
ncbi:MAG: DUF4445 domain-containing protein [Eubacterium sp.]|nr:DUF4445 domain-containing protein [Eubacterium sp.]